MPLAAGDVEGPGEPPALGDVPGDWPDDAGVLAEAGGDPDALETDAAGDPDAIGS